MAMTKKDFEGIAEALKDGRDALLVSIDPTSPELAQRVNRIFGSMCADVARVCARQNPRFDRARFMAACGIPPSIHT